MGSDRSRTLPAADHSAMREAEEIVVEGRSRRVAEQGGVVEVTAPEAQRSPAAALWKGGGRDEGDSERWTVKR